jgi:hypothetical protein
MPGVNNPSARRIAIGVVALCNCALLYVACGGLLTERPSIIAETSLAAVTIRGGLGGTFRKPIVGCILGLSIYAAPVD